MSARYATSALAIAILIACTGAGATQESGTALDVANIPAMTGAHTQQEIEFRRKSQSSYAVPIGIGEILHHSPGFSENSWDFENPDSIPGFGSLPADYNSHPVLPRFSGE